MPKYTGIEKKNGRFYARLQYKYRNYTPGKSFATAAEAYTWRMEKIKELKEGRAIIDTRIKLAEYLELYLKDYILPKLKDSIRSSTAKNIGSYFRNAIIPALGKYRLLDLSPKILQDFKNQLVIKYSSYHTKNVLIQLKRALKRAVIWKYLKENPAQDLEIPKIEIEKPVILSEDQLSLLLSKAEIREKAIIGLGGLAGLRVAEILGLQWKHIDFREGTIKIEGQFYRGTYTKPKTKYSIRTVPILEDLVPILKEWKLACPPGKWVFPGPEGEPIYGSSWQMYNFKPLLRELDLPDIKFHSLRHAFNKMLLDRGVPIREAMYIMGHSDPKVTIRVYDRESQERLLSVAKNIRIFPASRKKNLSEA